MKMNDSCKLPLTAACLFILAIGAPIPSKAGVGGGSGKPNTPYANTDKVNEEDLVKVKAISARCRDATVPFNRPDIPPKVKHLALVAAKGDKIAGELVYKFEGKDEAGKPSSVDFSDVKEFKLIRFQEKDCLLEIVIFPTIAPKDLLEKKPSYSELAANFISSVRLWVQVDTAAGDLAITGEDWDGKREFVAKVRDIKPNTVISVDYGRSKEMRGSGDAIWFATESVIKDPKYPHRLFFAK